MAASPDDIFNAILLERIRARISSAEMARAGGGVKPPALTTLAQHGHNALLLPGVIAKRAAGLYYSGKRTREWLKFKAVHEQEVVIVGHTEPRRSRKYFGSLVLAVRGKRANKRWSYALGMSAPALTRRCSSRSMKRCSRCAQSKEAPRPKVRSPRTATTWRLFPKLVGESKISVSGRVNRKCGTPI